MAPSTSCCSCFVVFPAALVILIAVIVALLSFNSEVLVIEASTPGHFIKKALSPRPNPQDKNVDVFIVIDGSSSISAQDFEKTKQVCLALSARIRPDAQLGVIQFGDGAHVQHTLSIQRESVEKSIIDMKQLGGGTNLNSALEKVNSEFALSRFPSNKREVWIVTDGEYSDPSSTSLSAQRLRREKQATIYAIGVGSDVSVISLEKVAAAGCSFLVNSFENALNLVKQKIRHDDLSVQTNLEILLPSTTYKFGEPVHFVINIENVGQQDIQKRSRIIFQENPYFKQKDVILTKDLIVGNEQSLEFKLVPKVMGSVNLEQQIINLPHVLEFSFLDSHNSLVVVDCSGYLLQHEHFSGNVFDFQPVYAEEPVVNILFFGPPGAGKSTFVNSILTALSERIHSASKIMNLGVAGGTSKTVTDSLEQFPLHEMPGFDKLKFALYDVPGIDGLNYKGDEVPLLVHGVMPTDVIFKDQALKYQHVVGRRGTLAEEWARRVHVVVFFVPQGVLADTDTMTRLSKVYEQLTVDLKRKAVVVIAHVDEIAGEKDRMSISQDVCNKLAIGSSSVYFLENYVDTKEKQFMLDKQIMRIIMAMLSRSNDFLLYERQNAIASPYGDYNPRFGYVNAQH